MVWITVGYSSFLWNSYTEFGRYVRIRNPNLSTFVKIYKRSHINLKIWEKFQINAKYIINEKFNSRYILIHCTYLQNFMNITFPIRRYFLRSNTLSQPWIFLHQISICLIQTGPNLFRFNINFKQNFFKWYIHNWILENSFLINLMFSGEPTHLDVHSHTHVEIKMRYYLFSIVMKTTIVVSFFKTKTH